MSEIENKVTGEPTSSGEYYIEELVGRRCRVSNEYLKPIDGYETFETQQRSQWVCYMFGTPDSNGLVWRPALGEEPNWFWRMMQYFVFGNHWVKEVGDE